MPRGIYIRNESNRTLNAAGHKYNNEPCPKCKKIHGFEKRDAGHKYNDKICPKCQKIHGYYKCSKHRIIRSECEECKKEFSLVCVKAQTGAHMSETIKNKISVKTTENWQDPEYAKMMSEAHLKTWQDPEHIEKMSKIHNDPEYIKNMSKSKLENWRDSEFAKKVLTRSSTHFNKLEQLINNILEKMFTNEYKYNDGWFNLTGKIPDFVNVNGQKKLIEANGCFYHGCIKCFPNGGFHGRIDDSAKRVELFKSLGWDTLLIWEHEKKDIKALEEKILNFNKKE